MKYGRVKHEVYMEIKSLVHAYIKEKQQHSFNCFKGGQPTSKHPCTSLITCPNTMDEPNVFELH